MTERRITDVVHQAGHFHNTFKGPVSAVPYPPVGLALLSDGLKSLSRYNALPAAPIECVVAKVRTAHCAPVKTCVFAANGVYKPESLDNRPRSLSKIRRIHVRLTPCVNDNDDAK